MRTAVAVLLGASLAGGACGHPAPPPPPPAPAAARAGPGLYARLGGVNAIRTVVGDFLARVAADGRINAFFRGVDLDSLQTKLTDQICQATGGPCRYAGKGMREAHADMTITDGDFDALIEDLAGALDHAGVGPSEERELLGTLNGLRGEIVTRR